MQIHIVKVGSSAPEYYLFFEQYCIAMCATLKEAIKLKQYFLKNRNVVERIIRDAEEDYDSTFGLENFA